MLRLAQRWEKSDNPDDRDRAKSLRAALKLIEEKGVEKLFKDLVEGLGSKNPTSGDFNTCSARTRSSSRPSRRSSAVLETEDETERIARRDRGAQGG